MNSPHLTDVQFTDLLLGELSSAEAQSSEAHLHACAKCSAELDGLRDSLALFQQATLSHSDREFERIQHRAPATRRPSLLPASNSVPAFTWLAAAALLVAAVLPLQNRLHLGQPGEASAPAVAQAPAQATHTAQSDEALLEDINRELAASVPESMQSLADPTGTSTQSSQ